MYSFLFFVSSSLFALLSSFFFARSASFASRFFLCSSVSFFSFFFFFVLLSFAPLAPEPFFPLSFWPLPLLSFFFSSSSLSLSIVSSFQQKRINYRIHAKLIDMKSNQKNDSHLKSLRGKMIDYWNGGASEEVDEEVDLFFFALDFLLVSFFRLGAGDSEDSSTAVMVVSKIVPSFCTSDSESQTKKSSIAWAIGWNNHLVYFMTQKSYLYFSETLNFDCQVGTRLTHASWGCGWYIDLSCCNIQFNILQCLGWQKTAIEWRDSEDNPDGVCNENPLRLDPTSSLPLWILQHLHLHIY